jgi:hypothetical protein
MKSSILWDIMPCSPLKVNRRFGGKFRLHLQGRRASKARDQHGPGSFAWCILHVALLLRLILKMEATCTSETLVDFKRNTLSYIP